MVLSFKRDIREHGSVWTRMILGYILMEPYKQYNHSISTESIIISHTVWPEIKLYVDIASSNQWACWVWIFVRRFLNYLNLLFFCGVNPARNQYRSPIMVKESSLPWRCTVACHDCGLLPVHSEGDLVTLDHVQRVFNTWCCLQDVVYKEKMNNDLE